jgi:hypothetical protein
MKNFGKLGGALLMVTLLIAFSAPAMADTMTFSGYSTPPSYSNNGMTVTSLVEHIHLYGGQLYNHSNCCSTPYRFEIGGGAFNLNNIVVTNNFGGFGDTFVSSNGGTVTLSSLGTLNFSGPDWTGITYFDWNSNAGDTYISSVTYNNTPEPGSLFLLGTGLLGMGGAVRRKFKV